MTTKKSKTVKWGEEPKLGWIEAMYLPAIASGLATALRHVFAGKTTTRQYPEVEPEIPPNYRGVHRLNRDEEGRVKCVACYMCQTACPAQFGLLAPFHGFRLLSCHSALSVKFRSVAGRPAERGLLIVKCK